MAEPFPDVMTIKETSQYLRVPLYSLYKLAQDGKIPSQKVGRHWRFNQDGKIPSQKVGRHWRFN